MLGNSLIQRSNTSVDFSLATYIIYIYIEIHNVYYEMYQIYLLNFNFNSNT